jgi:hypothetical protein
VRRLPDPELTQLDFVVRDVGSLVILDPLNDAATSWAEGRLEESVMRWGSGFVIEPRYLPPIIQALLVEGFGLEEA